VIVPLDATMNERIGCDDPSTIIASVPARTEVESEPW
jgi:hypothetical protein